MEKYKLDNEGIASAVRAIGDGLLKNRAEHREAVSVPLAAEELLLQYREKAGSTEGEFSVEKRFGRLRMILRLDGERFDPVEDVPEEENLLHRMMENLGQAPVIGFRQGRNVIVFTVDVQKKISPLGAMLLAMALGVGSGLAARFLFRETASVFYTDFLSPVLSAVMGLITTLSLFLIFFSIVSGVAGMGDLSVFKKVGKKLAGQSALLHGLSAALAVGLSLLFFTVGRGETGSFNAASIWKMIVDTVPTNVVGAFSEGKALQVIFLAVISGIMLLALGEKMNGVLDLVGQLNRFFLALIQEIVRYMPLVVFISVFNMAVNSDFASMLSVYKYPLLCFLCGGIVVLTEVLRTAVSQKMPFSRLLKKTATGPLIALTSSSASAAFSQVLKDCKKELGVDRRLTDVSVPLGQMLFRPNMGFQLLFGCLCFAEIFGVPVTAAGFATTVLSALLLAVAAPPVAGSTIPCFEIMLVQLGVPLEAISIALAFNVIVTPVNLSVQYFCLETETVETADKLRMLDKETLRREKEK